MSNFFDTLKKFFAPNSNRFGRLWDFLTRPHSSIAEVGERRRAQLLSALSLILVVSFTWAVLSNPASLTIFFFFLGITLFAYITGRTKFYNVGAYFFSFGFTSIAYWTLYSGNANSVDTAIASTVPISLILASAILSQRGFLILVFATVAATGSIQVYADPKFLADPLFSFGRTIGVTSSIGFILVGITAFRENVERARLKEVKTVNHELEILSANLEQRVAERIKALETSAEVSRRLASILDPRQLTSAVVNDVRNAYDYYYVQIYLFDDSGKNLVLTAGTGKAGEAMLQRGHSLPKGSGLVGQAAESNKPVLVPDTSQASNWLSNDLLPDTKAEAAIPITIGGQVLGVLDVQDDITNEITSSDITLLVSLANQVAVSLNNARQYQQSQSLREQYALAVESSNDGIWDWDIANSRIYYSARWKAMLGFEEHELTRGFVEWEERIHPEDHDYAKNALEDYLAQRAPAYDVEIRLKHKDGTWRWVRDRGKALRRPDGSAYRMAGSNSDITERKHGEALIGQRARQQEAINLITQRIQSSTTIEEAMQVAARELGNALGRRQTVVTLNPVVNSDNWESAS